MTKPASLKASKKKPSMAATVTENSNTPRMTQSAMLIVVNLRWSCCGSNLQFASRQLTVCPEVLIACPPRYFLGEGRRGRLLVPANFFEVVPYILLVVRVLRFARLIGVGWPEAGGIRCKNFVRQSNALGGLSKFKLGVRDDDAALQSVIGGLFVDAEREVAEFAAQFRIDDLAHFLE